jgi:hypothetical protein
VDHSQSAARFQPFFHFFAGMVRSLIDLQDDFPSRANLKQLFQPTDRRVRVLPVGALPEIWRSGGSCQSGRLPARTGAGHADLIA